MFRDKLEKMNKFKHDIEKMDHQCEQLPLAMDHFQKIYSNATFGMHKKLINKFTEKTEFNTKKIKTMMNARGES